VLHNETLPEFATEKGPAVLSTLIKTMLATSVIATGLVIFPPSVTPAGANQITLQEWLSNRSKKKKRKTLLRRSKPQKKVVQPRAKPKPAAPKKPAIRRVAGPQYYAYKARALQQVTIASLLPDVESTGSIAVIGLQSAPVVAPGFKLIEPVDPPIASDTEQQGEPAVAAETAPAPSVSIPPLTVLDETAPPIPATENATQASEAATETVRTDDEPGVAIPEMTVLEAVAPPVPQDEAIVAAGEVEASQPAIAIPDMPVLEAAPVRLASTDYFAMAVRQAPEKTLRIEPDVAEALRALYAGRRDYLWSDGVVLTKAGKALAEKVNEADTHGLDADHYAVQLPLLPRDPRARAQALIAFDVTLTARAIRLARDLKDGVVDPNKLSGYHDFPGERLSADAAAEALTNEADAAAWLASLAPRQPHYAALQAELAELHQSEDNAIVFPDRVFMKPGTQADVLPLVMKAIDRKIRTETADKHAEAIANYDGNTAYDGGLVDLVRDVQRDLGLIPDGIVGPKTVARLGGESVADRILKIELAMERLRWHPEEFGPRHVVINQPEYRVRYLENGETALAMNVIVGKKSNQTYFFHDTIETVVFNPYWGVPQSIIVNEMLPRLHRDPGYLDRAGYVVSTRSGKRIASSNINWRKYSGPVPYNVRQKPGPSNALGELKILFPNEHAIYMHDTPAKNLFSRSTRAYSHGCVRLEDPRAMAAAVLGKSRDYISSQLGGYERGEKLTEQVPVYVSYFTAWPDDNGSIIYSPDVYDRDSHLNKAMEKVSATREG
jgi:murein L,D-transpeptidase YcbB/YkuD